MSNLVRVRGFNNTHLLIEEVGYDGKLYFQAAPDYDTKIYEDGQRGSVVWETNGTKEGTKVVHDFAPGDTSFVPIHLRVANDHLFLQIRIDEQPSSRYELWSYRNTEDPNDIDLNRLVLSLDGKFPDYRFDDNIEATKNGLFFLQKDDEGLNELWFTNGSPGSQNTYSLGGNGPGKPLSSFVRLIGADNLLYFVADGREFIPGRDEPVYDPNELWSTTSQPGTFEKLTDFDYKCIASFCSPINHEEAIGNDLYFTGRTEIDTGDTSGIFDRYVDDLEPWISQGTDQTTQQLANVNPGRTSNNWPLGTVSRHFTYFKGEIYFLGTNREFDDDPSETLYAYNPGSGNVRVVAQTAQEWRNYSHRELFVFNDNIYFSGQTDSTGWELWRSDGTTQGTGLLKDLKSNGDSSSHPQNFAIHKKDRLLYSAEDDDLYFHTEFGKVWKVSGDTGFVSEVNVDDRRWEGAGNITSVDIANGATDLYFTSGLSLYKLSGQQAGDSQPSPEPQPTPEPQPGTEPQPEIPPEPDLTQQDGIIESVQGRGKLKGTEAADVFAFRTPDVFSKNTADRIIKFNPAEGDSIALNVFIFPGLEINNIGDLRFASTNSKKELRQLAKQDYDFVYYEGKGRLYYNGNGTVKKWGNEEEGGLVAILKGGPELTINNLSVLV